MLTSIVIPCKDEADNLGLLLDEIAEAMAEMSFEVIVVDDGSADATHTVLAQKRAGGYPVRHIRHAVSTGQSMAIRSGLLASRGEIVATLDGDGQNDPRYIPALVSALMQADPSVGMVIGQRLRRQDTRGKKTASRLANWVRVTVLGDHTRDTGCGLKAVRADLFRRLPFFNGSHRFLPALMLQEGFGVLNIDVVDRPRRHGVSHYGIFDRGMRATVDLFGVWWLKQRRSRTPQVSEITDG